MREYTDRALDTATSRGATYADVRIVRRENQDITVKILETSGKLASSTMVPSGS